MKSRESSNGILLQYQSEDRTIQLHIAGVDHSWPDLLPEFANFLRAIGYVLPPGELHLITEEDEIE